MERTPELSHGGATGFRAPPGVTLHYMDPAKGENLGGMMANGELDAVYVYFTGSGINRSTLDLHAHEQVRTLFSSPLAESARYYAKTGIYPINHVVIMRRSLYEQHPWAARNLYDAFVKAKDLWAARTLEQAQPFIDAGLLPPEARAALSTDLFPYGVAANPPHAGNSACLLHRAGAHPARRNHRGSRRPHPAGHIGRAHRACADLARNPTPAGGRAPSTPGAHPAVTRRRTARGPSPRRWARPRPAPSPCPAPRAS